MCFLELLGFFHNVCHIFIDVLADLIGQPVDGRCHVIHDL